MATILPDYLMDNATAVRSGAASSVNMTTGVDAASGAGAGLGAYLGAGMGLLNAYNTFSANSQILNTEETGRIEKSYRGNGTASPPVLRLPQPGLQGKAHRFCHQPGNKERDRIDPVG